MLTRSVRVREDRRSLLAGAAWVFLRNFSTDLRKEAVWLIEPRQRSRVPSAFKVSPEARVSKACSTSLTAVADSVVDQTPRRRGNPGARNDELAASERTTAVSVRPGDGGDVDKDIRIDRKLGCGDAFEGELAIRGV